jgi:hypothetical protein
MKEISKSPKRHTFQKEGYLKRCDEKGEKPDDNYLEMFQNILAQDAVKFDDSKSRENNMEYDLLTTDWILEKVRSSDTYAQNLYAAMCNNDFQKLEVIPILKDQTWGCSWRYAGGIIADMRQKGDYIDWYCSGIGDGLGNGDRDGSKSYVGESVITDEIRKDLKCLGWIEADWKNVNE